MLWLHTFNSNSLTFASSNRGGKTRSGPVAKLAQMYYLDRLLAALGSRDLPEEIQASTVSVVEGTAVEIVPLGASPQRPQLANDAA